MSILHTPSDAGATGLTAEIYQENLRSLGHVPSQTKAAALNPEAYRAWESLVHAISTSLGPRRYELVVLAAAKAAGSEHYLLEHGLRALEVFDEDQLRHIAKDFRSAGLSPDEVAMMDFAAKASTDPASMSDVDSLILRDQGFNDREILDITLAAGACTYFSRVMLALVVEVDVPSGLSAGLKEALLGAHR
ncbi:carboxymuconolactone decarboxylase family protein [Arthrobacter sp. PAMC25284]|uniref:carboxymuconolactone decarboxylase family protein n=1 Tax=Arthrobacter sp. PAMC25284 TaxID=2861279 RepID=UPI001C6281F6|nr:carboxymuconolactone decarboxylase family protein [Arthrobacter sp. PAMC25284]QYF89365.1 carboxymuconolactone decarboxylase family protein [Arthrobacter sp. PAMC25284]